MVASILWLALPESPRFLAARPRLWPRLVDFLRRMGHSLDRGTAFEDPASNITTNRVSMSALFSAELRRDTVGLWIAFFFCLGSIYLVFGWLPTLLTTQGIGIATASSGLAIYNFGGVLGVLLLAVLMSLRGSRGPLLAGALATAASALLLLLVPIHGDVSPVWLLAGIGLNGLLANAIQTSMYAVAAHIYPTSVRSSGVAYAAGIGRVGGIVSSMIGAEVIRAGVATYWVSLAMAMVFTFLGLAWVRNHIPAHPTIRK
jgi:AAHS family 4-hydroxybenzoate transporter-like MFS transporter